MLCKYPSFKGEYWGGVATHVKSLSNCIENYVNEDFEFYIISFGNKKDFKNILEKNLILININWYYYIFPLLPLLKLFKEVNRIHPDIIHIQGTNISPYSLYSLLNIGSIINKSKIIFTVHNIYHLELISLGLLKRDSIIFKIFFNLEKLFLRQASHVIVVNTTLKRYLINNLSMPENNVSVIYNGVDVNVFNPMIDGNNIRNKLKIEKNDFILLFAKKFHANNGPQYLLGSLPLILDTFANVKIILAGDGPLRNELITITKELGIKENVFFTGIISYEEIKYYIAASDVVVIPSISYSGFEEGLPNIMLEGMAIGKPIIASNIGGLREIMSDHDIGVLVEEKDAKSIAKAVISLITDPGYKNYLSKNARDFVCQNLSWTQIAEKTTNIYHHIFESSKKM